MKAYRYVLNGKKKQWKKKEKKKKVLHVEPKRNAKFIMYHYKID